MRAWLGVAGQPAGGDEGDAGDANADPERDLVVVIVVPEPGAADLIVPRSRYERASQRDHSGKLRYNVHMPKLFRVMLKGKDNRPVTGDRAGMLGARVPFDITPDEAGRVHPSTGGMSVSPSLASLPARLVPVRLRALVTGARGKNEHFVWSMGEGAFVACAITNELSLRPENDRHGLIEPGSVMRLTDYQTALASTKHEWSEDEN